jgi:hypothetical protein
MQHGKTRPINPVSLYCAQAARGWVALAEQVERIDIEIDIGGI